MWLSSDTAAVKEAMNTIAVPVALFRVSVNERFFLACRNNLADEYYGRSTQHYVGQFMDDLLADHEQDDLERQQLNRTIAFCEMCCRKDDQIDYGVGWELTAGKTRWSKNTMVPISEGGAIRGLFVTVREYRSVELFKHSQDDPVLQGTTLCAWCEKIRRGDHDWISAEKFLSKEFNVAVSHGICPDCRKTLIQE